MGLNKKGGFMIAAFFALFFFMFGIMFVSFMKDEVTTSRGADYLDCTNSTITDGNKLTCIMVDIPIPYFIVTIVSIAGGLIANKFIG